jgi:solute carrier family 35 protein E1
MAVSSERDLEIASSESFLGTQPFRPGDAGRNSDEHPAFASPDTNSGKNTTAPVISPMRRLSQRISLPARRMSQRMAGKIFSIDAPLILCFALWYAGNYYYNITNKQALQAGGGATGYPMTIATLQLGVGCIYALFLWAAPDARQRPTITFNDYINTLPVGFTAAGAHAASVFALSAGAVSFAQIVKAAEPAFAAVVGTCFYGISVSTAKWLALVPVIGGVILASVGELSFSWGALITAAIANIFAAVKGNENKKLMSTEGLADRLGSVGNQFALTTINAFLFCVPLMLATEGWKLAEFWELCKTTPVLRNNLVFSGLWFYLYNEVATLTIKKTSAVTQSVANTAKRVIVIIVIALVMNEHLGTLKLVGCSIGIGGVFLYSIIDKLVERCR